MGNFGGFTPATHRLVTLPDGRRAFAKGATTSLTESWLRDEHKIYTHLSGSFMPQLIGWDDSGDRPVLLLEDLTDARWPPPWRPGDEEIVLAALEELHAATPPPGLPGAGDEFADSWPEVMRDPVPLLGLGLVSDVWLDRNLATFAAASQRAQIAGDSVAHRDIRSDNSCFTEVRTRCVDWTCASLG